MTRTIIGILVAGSMCVSASDTAAQEPHPMYLVRQEFVRPALISQYEDETARWVARLQEKGMEAEVQWVSVVGPELGYSYVVPIDGFTGIDVFRTRLTEGQSGVQGRWADAAGQPVPLDRFRSFVISLRPELSYLPRTVELDLTLPFRKYHWYYVTPGMEARFEDTIRRLVALYTGFGVEHGFRLYEFELGQDLPIFLLVERAADEADYASRTARILETVGAQADALFGDLLRSTRRLEVMEGMVNGALSFPPLDASAVATMEDMEEWEDMDW